MANDSDRGGVEPGEAREGAAGPVEFGEGYASVSSREDSAREERRRGLTRRMLLQTTVPFLMLVSDATQSFGGSHTDSHGDSHGDSNSHTDSHSDGHLDIPHGDHTDSTVHSDHSDTHTDIPTAPYPPHTDGSVHTDSYTYHNDASPWFGTHTDFNHTDHVDNGPHIDIAHYDHDDAVSSPPHSDSPHWDTYHSDIPHSDSTHDDSVNPQHIDNQPIKLG